MEVPSPAAGVVKQLAVKVGDRVSEGSVLLTLEPADGEARGAEGPAPGRRSRRRRRPRRRRPRPGRRPHPSPARGPTPPGPPAPGPAPDADVHGEVVVLGSGPGGYNAAFRAADLGLKTVLIERYETLGGVCLNVGCIPSKALLHMSRVVAEAEEAAEAGIEFGKPQVDLDKLRSWKQSVVDKLTGGLDGLAKQRKVEVVRGTGRFASERLLEVEAAGKTTTVAFDNCVIAAGSSARDDPGASRRRAGDGLDRRPGARRGPGQAARDRRRDHRARDGDRLRRARLEGDRGRDARLADPGLRSRPGATASQADRRPLRGDPAGDEGDRGEGPEERAQGLLRGQGCA